MQATATASISAATNPVNFAVNYLLYIIYTSSAQALMALSLLLTTFSLILQLFTHFSDLLVT